MNIKNNFTVKQEQLLNLIRTGKENAITCRKLSQLTGLTDREVTLNINYIRCNGKVICSSGDGYYFPSCIDDVKRFYRQMTSRQIAIEKAKESAKEYIKEYGSV